MRRRFGRRQPPRPSGDKRRQPLPGNRVGAHEGRGRRKTEEPDNLADALRFQVLSLARRQVDGAVAHAPDAAARHKSDQPTVVAREWVAQEACQFRRVDERHSAESVQKLSLGGGHTPSLARPRPLLLANALRQTPPG